MWMIQSFDLRAMFFDWVKKSVREAVGERFSHVMPLALPSASNDNNDVRTLH